MQGGATCHTTAEIRAFFNAQFQNCVISCKAKVKWLPYSPNLPYFWSYAIIHLAKKKLSTINEQKKDVVHMIPEQMIQDTVGNIHKNAMPTNKLKATTLSLFCNTYKNCFELSFRC